tara:strand:+ start:76 stop:888 length:813 start_codon:yes stop_codon:yes gene_type:complete
MKNNVAVIQMTSCANVTENLKKVETLLALAASKQVRLAVLPENFAFMGLNESDKLALAETYMSGPIQLAISQMAKKYRLWIVAGTIPLASDDPARCYASCLVFNSEGECVLRYDKMHLFDVQVSSSESHKESNSTCAGTQLKVIDTPVGRIGLSVCYDVRFPEFYRQLRELGADILIVPAAFTFDSGKVHWHTLLKARAIENLSYVLAANQGGEHQNGRKTYGHSMIISPWGNVETSCNESEVTIAIAAIDIERMIRTRETFPCLNHRKL